MLLLYLSYVCRSSGFIFFIFFICVVFTCAGVKDSRGALWVQIANSSSIRVQVPASTCRSPTNVSHRGVRC